MVEGDRFERHRGVLRAVIRGLLGTARVEGDSQSEALGAHGWDGSDPVGLALFAVLESLTPAERLAFLLHDVFAMPGDEVAAIVGRPESATRQLARQARVRLRGRGR